MELHNDWHAENGSVGTVLCPWDCYDPPVEDDEEVKDSWLGWEKIPRS